MPHSAVVVLRSFLVVVAVACAKAASPPSPAPTPAPAVTDTARRDTTRRDTTRRDTSATFDRSQRPAIGPAPSVSLPPLQTRELSNGMKLVVVEQHELPLADFVLLVNTGGEADPPARPGLATLTADLLREGAASRNSLQIADQEAFLGVELNSAAGWDQSRVTLHTPTAQLDSALALFADVALRPSFPTAELERLRKERLTELLQLRDRPPAIADRAYAAAVFGDRHPYGHALVGTETAARAITRADVQRFYQAAYRPSNATLIAVGDLSADDVARRAEALFGKWRGGAAPAAAYPAAPRAGATTVYIVDKPGAVQSSIRIGGVGAARSTSDYFPLVVMNTILGGSFTSRLNQNLRETHGYTYGARSRFDMRRQAGPFTASAEVTATKTDSSLLEFMKELRAIRDTVPAAELEKAKRFLQLQLPGNFETTASIATQVVPIVLYGLPLDYYNGYVRQIERVTQADVQRVARQYVDPANVTIVVVGDRKSIEPGIRALGLGTVVVRDLEGRQQASAGEKPKSE
ncbi:MAG: M16 family metallopeptidase [Gemmatimonadaceae bacterium]